MFDYKVDWKSKLTSRKFWAAIAEFVTMLILAFHGTQETATQVAAIIMAGAAVVAYIIGEGLADAASAGNESPIVFNGTLGKLDDSEKAQVEILNKILDFAKEDSAEDDGK